MPSERLLGAMAFAPEFNNPILYLNALALGASSFVFFRARKLNAAPWTSVMGIIAAGTLIHFLGDLTGLDENIDHVLIHAVLLVALVPAAMWAMREP